MENDIDVFKHFFQKLFEYPAIKILAGFFVWFWQALFGTVFRPAYGIVGLMWLIDTMTGYYHAWVNPTIRPDSRRMYHGLVKVSIYYFLLMLGYQMSRPGFEAIIAVQTLFEVAIMATEGKSIFENLKKIGTLKKWRPELMAIIDWVLAIFEGKLSEITGGN